MAAPVPVVSASSLRSRVQSLCALGNRFVGTPGEKAARDYIRAELSRLDLASVRVEEFTVLGYQPGGAWCTVTGVPDGALPAVGLQFTASAAVEAEAVYIGNPRSIDDIASLRADGVNIDGKAVIVDTYWPYGLSNYLSAAGAAALVVISPNLEGRMTHFSARLYPPVQDDSPVPIPGVTIERSAGQRLLALMSAGTQRLRVDHRAGYLATPTANVVAEIAGTELPGERVVIGAHYDTQLEGVGACDNATGIAALLELATLCSAQPKRRTITFVAFADEEHGLRGAVEYCRRHRDTLDATVGMVCLDALAWLYPARRAVHADPSLLDYAVARATEAGWVAEEIIDASSLIGSDHNAFIDAGVPSVWFWRYPPQHFGYHSTGDRLELLDFDLVAEAAAAAGHTAFALADEMTTSLGRSRPSTRWHDLRPDPLAEASRAFASGTGPSSPMAPDLAHRLAVDDS